MKLFHVCIIFFLLHFLFSSSSSQTVRDLQERRPPVFRSLQYKKELGHNLTLLGSNEDEPDAFHDMYLWRCHLETKNPQAVLTGEFSYTPRNDGLSLPSASMRWSLMQVVEYVESGGGEGFQPEHDTLVQVWNEEAPFGWAGDASTPSALQGWAKSDTFGTNNIGLYRFLARTSADPAQDGQFGVTARAAPAKTTADGVVLDSRGVSVQYEIERFPFLRPENGAATSLLAFGFKLEASSAVQMAPGEPQQISWVEVHDSARFPSQPDANYRVNLQQYWAKFVTAQNAGDGGHWDDLPVHTGAMTRTTQLESVEYTWWASVLAERHYELYSWDTYFQLHYYKSTPSAATGGAALSVWCVMLLGFVSFFFMF